MSDFPLIMFLSPEALFFVGIVLILGAWIYGLYWSISKLKDPNEKKKGGPLFLLLSLLGILGAFIYSIVSKNNTIVTTPSPPKTTMGAPQPPSNAAGSMTTTPLPQAPPIPQANAAPNH